MVDTDVITPGYTFSKYDLQVESPRQKKDK